MSRAPEEPCAWCLGPLPVDARRDAIYCSKRCRQAAHRFRAGYQPKPTTTSPLRLAYADPPYPGMARKCYRDHPDFAGEVDHAELAQRLVDEYPDGWALSTSAAALPEVLEHVRAAGATDAWVASWTRGYRPTRSRRPLSTWEPVIVRGGRQELPEDAGATRRLDALVYVARGRLTDPNRVTGAKPAEFLWWLFDLLGAETGDELDDIYPGSGGVSRAWRILQHGAPRPPATRLLSIDPRQLELLEA